MSNPRIKWGSDNLPSFPAITREHYVETPEAVIDYMRHLERTVAALARHVIDGRCADISHTTHTTQRTK